MDWQRIYFIDRHLEWSEKPYYVVWIHSHIMFSFEDFIGEYIRSPIAYAVVDDYGNLVCVKIKE